jgi:hypothetical protein
MVTALVQGQNATIKVEFIINGEKAPLNNDFEIYFIVVDTVQKIIIKPEIKQNSFEIPNFCGNVKGHIVFKYKKNIIGLGLNNFNYSQNMRWEIGFDKKPYDKEYGIKEANKKETKGIAYIAFHPLEHGDGTVTTISIIDLKKYFKESKTLIE